jgi:hypothetical protein
MLIDNFDVVNYEKNDSRFDIWLDEKETGVMAILYMIPVVATDVVSGVLCKSLSVIRSVVRTITTDLSLSMMVTVRWVFLGAALINYRFHV